MDQPVLATVSSNTCSQIHVQIKHSLAYLQDLVPTLAGIKYIRKHTPAEVSIKSCGYARECYVYTCIWLCVLELTVANIGRCTVTT